MPDLSSAAENIAAAFRAALEEAGAREVEAIRESVSTPGPPASAVGTPPHLRSGRLRNSIGFSVSGDAEAGLILEIEAGGSTAPYAARVEQDRPFMAPALARLRESVVSDMAEQFRARFG